MALNQTNIPGDFNILLYAISWSRWKKTVDNINNTKNNNLNVILYQVPGRVLPRILASGLDAFVVTYFFFQIVAFLLLFKYNVRLITLFLIYIFIYVFYNTFLYKNANGGYQTLGKYIAGLHLVDSSSLNEITKFKTVFETLNTVTFQLDLNRLAPLSFFRRLQRSLWKILFLMLYFGFLPLNLPYWEGPHDWASGTVLLLIK
ncbi:hypothetical protein HZS_6003 [Henneguya salminicola]|nr:hypothetical protein HZS_6003 [Henneguya salminicola]